MSKRITNAQVEEFLKDIYEEGETIILEEGKEKNELLESARKRGIIISDSNRDLGVIKSIFCFTTKANANKARLPKKEFIKIFPQIVGRPMTLEHDRHFILGFYIDYKYILKDEKAITYSIFFRGNYPKLWEKVKDFQKKKKLSSSYEIWSPVEEREELSDGTYYLHNMAMAGGALIFEEYGDVPAFRDAKVLNIASKEIKDYIGEDCLVYASKYKEEDLITSSGDIFKDAVKKNVEKLRKEKEAQQQVKEETPKVVPKPEPLKQEPPKPVIIKIKCSNCGTELEYNGTDVKVKCSECFAILNKEGVMQYPPQVKDFKVLCPSCKVNNWLIVQKGEKETKIKCLNCSKVYEIEFAVTAVDTKKILDQFNFLYTGRVTCHQCGTPVYFSGVSTLKNRTLKCKKCGLVFPFDITHEVTKKINSIKEVKEIENSKKSSEKGGDKTMEFKIEVSKYHRDVDDFEKLSATIPDDYGESKEVAKRLTTEQRNALPDSMFAVVVRVKDKRTGKMRKIRKFPINDEAHVRNALARLGQPAPQATLRKLGVSVETVRRKILRRARQLKMTQLLERYKKSSKKDKGALPKEVTDCVRQKTKGGGMKPADAVKECWAEFKKKQRKEAKVEKPKVEEQLKVKETLEAGKEPKAKETPKTEVKQPVKAEKVEETKETIEQYEDRVTKAMVEQASKEIETANQKSREEALQADVEKLTNQVAKMEKEIKLYKANAKKIVKRREELGEFAEGLTDEDLLDKLKFENAQLKKELANKPIEEESIETASEVVGDKAKDGEYYTKKQAEINDKAFPKK